MFEKIEMDKIVREQILTQWDGKYEDVKAVGKLSSLCKVVWRNNKEMWSYLKSMSKEKHEIIHQQQQVVLWHSMDKPEHERLMSKKISTGLKAVQTHIGRQLGIAEESAKDLVAADWGAAYLFTKLPGHRIQKIIHKPRNQEVFSVVEGWQQSGIVDLDIQVVCNTMNEAE